MMTPIDCASSTDFDDSVFEKLFESWIKNQTNKLRNDVNIKTLSEKNTLWQSTKQMTLNLNKKL